MTIIEPACAAAVEGDGTDARMCIEQVMDGVRELIRDRRIRAGQTLSRLADVPKRDPLRQYKGQLLSIDWRRRIAAKQGKHDRPKQIAGMRVILGPARRFLAG